jgi:NADPH-dependent 2,4-dienoyl-CoA reductase/sulfur reductase-like enzyme
MDLCGSGGRKTILERNIVTMAGWMLSLACGVCLLTPVLGVLLESYKDAKSAYDYVIVGGGTAGLTVADRLSESGKHTVLVVEYGYLGKS